MMKTHWFLRYLVPFALLCMTSLVASSNVDKQPNLVIQQTIDEVLDQFVMQRDVLAKDKRKLYRLVDELVSPLFDFSHIAKLVLAKSWKSADSDEKTQFEAEFKKLLIVTYATALFQYTGEEKMVFQGTKITKRKDRLFAKVDSEITLGQGNPIPIVYSMIQNRHKQWKIYNLKIGSLNMVLNYRNVIQASIRSNGLQGTIATIKENNDKVY